MDTEAKDIMIRERIFEENTTLFMEKEATDCAYILREGRLKVYKNDQMIVELDEPGTFVGELGLILDTPRTATVKIARRARLGVISSPLITLLTTTPGLVTDMVNLLFGRLEITYNRVTRMEEVFVEELIKIFLYEWITKNSSRFGNDLQKLGETKNSLRRGILDHCDRNNLPQNLDLIKQMAKDQHIGAEFMKTLQSRFPDYNPLDLRTYLPAYQIDFVSAKEGMDYLKIIAAKIVELTKRFTIYETFGTQRLESSTEDFEEILPYIERENLLMRAFMDKHCYGRIEAIREKKHYVDRILYELREDNRDKDINRISLIEVAKKSGFLEQYNNQLQRRATDWKKLTQLI